MTSNQPTPGDILERVAHIKNPVALDTETSGLFVDDGARMSTISLAWIDEDGWWTRQYGLGQTVWPGGILTIRDEPVFEDEGFGDHLMRVVSVAWPFDQGVAGTGKAEDTGQDTLWPEAANQPKDQYDNLLMLLATVGVANGLVMHHAKFDTHIMRAGVRRWPGVGIDLLDQVTWDTQNGNALLYADGRVRQMVKGQWVATTSLKPTAKALWGESEGDEQKIIQAYLKSHKLPAGRWDLMPWEVIGKYADGDARMTIRLMYRQQADMGAVDWIDPTVSMDRRLAVSRMLARIERRALPFDVSGALKASAQVRQRAAELEAQLPFHPATLDMAKHYWFGQKGEEKKGIVSLGLQPYATTDTGGVSITAEIVDRMVKDGIPGAAAWRNLQKANTADSRWYAGYASMAGSDGRLRASFRQNGTVSGRFSVERVQLQAIPHNYRLEGYEVLDGIPTPRDLIASGIPDGYELWELDLANAEARVAAHLARCKPMLDMIVAGVDLHGEVTKQLFNIDPTSHEWGFWRNIGKRADFSFIFGVGWETFQEAVRTNSGVQLTEAECRKIVRDWNGIFPQYKKAIEVHQRRVEQRMRRNGGVGYIEMINGERRWFQKGEDTHKAFNQRVQGNLAQFGMDWWLEAEQHTRDLYGDEPLVHDGTYVGQIGVVMLTHDSIDLLLPAGDPDGVVAKVQEMGVTRWGTWFKGVPGGVDAKRFNDE